MKLEQLYYFFDLARDTLLSLTVTPAAVELHQVMRSLVAGIVERTRATMVRIVLDAAALKGETELLALMNMPGVEVVARAVRSQKYMKQWRAIPEGRWTSHEEPDETKGRPPRVLEVATTTTRIGPDRTPVRTIVAREHHGRNKKECYHVLYTNVAHEHACSLVNEFRLRQRHEQAYRVGVHDLSLDGRPGASFAAALPARSLNILPRSSGTKVRSPTAVRTLPGSKTCDAAERLPRDVRFTPSFRRNFSNSVSFLRSPRSVRSLDEGHPTWRRLVAVALKK